MKINFYKLILLINLLFSIIIKNNLYKLFYWKSIILVKNILFRKLVIILSYSYIHNFHIFNDVYIYIYIYICMYIYKKLI
jgi:hypothetical protein